MSNGSLTKMSIREENERLKWTHYRMLPSPLRRAQVLSGDCRVSALSVLGSGPLLTHPQAPPPSQACSYPTAVRLHSHSLQHSPSLRQLFSPTRLLWALLKLHDAFRDHCPPLLIFIESFIFYQIISLYYVNYYFIISKTSNILSNWDWER